jgi:hypothetical protein
MLSVTSEFPRTQPTVESHRESHADFLLSGTRSASMITGGPSILEGQPVQGKIAGAGATLFDESKELSADSESIEQIFELTRLSQSSRPRGRHFDSAAARSLEEDPAEDGDRRVRLVEEIMRPLCSTAGSRRDVACRPWDWLEERDRHEQGRAVRFACPDDFVRRGHA